MSNKRILIKNGKALIDETGKVLVAENIGVEGATIKTKGTWQGTPVEIGYVENVYLNTNLSVDEVVSIIENLTFVNGAYFILHKDSSDMSLVIINEGIGYAIADVITNTYYFHNVVDEEVANRLGFPAGWNPNITMPIVVNGGIDCDSENTKLTSLISTTPFTYQEGTPIELSGEYDGSNIEVKAKSSGLGTTVESGNIGNVYLNTDLSIEEVVSIIESANLTYNDGVYILAKKNDNSLVLIIAQENDIRMIGDFTSGQMYFHNSEEENIVTEAGFTKGWNPNITMPIVVNGEAMCGSENAKLISLFSLTPFEKIAEINLLDYIENGKLPLKIKVK